VINTTNIIATIIIKAPILVIETCKTMSDNNSLHSRNISSSHSHNLHRHCQASPPSTTNENMSPTKQSLLTLNSYKRLNYTDNRTPPTHESVQKNVSIPFPTFLNIYKHFKLILKKINCRFNSQVFQLYDFNLSNFKQVILTLQFTPFLIS